MQTPSVGRIVHFVHPSPGHRDDSTVCFPAIVVRVDAHSLLLTTFTPNGPQVVSAQQDEEHGEVGTWHWPEVV